MRRLRKCAPGGCGPAAAWLAWGAKYTISLPVLGREERRGAWVRVDGAWGAGARPIIAAASLQAVLHEARSGCTLHLSSVLTICQSSAPHASSAQRAGQEGRAQLVGH